MPKVTNSEQAPKEPMYATVPIRMSSRTTRFPRRVPRAEWTPTSYTPPQTSGHRWYADGAEDVTMHPPAAQVAIKLEHSAETLTQVGMNQGPLQGIEHYIKEESGDVEIRLALESLSMEPHALPPIVASNDHLMPKIEVEEHPPPLARRVNELRMNEVEERFRLEHAIETIDALNARIHNLQKTEQRLKKQLREEKERLKNSKAEGEGALNLLVMAEEKICEVEGLMAFLKQDVDRYRRWWLTEYHSLKAVIAMLPHSSKADAVHIAEGAHARYATFSTSP